MYLWLTQGKSNRLNWQYSVVWYYNDIFFHLSELGPLHKDIVLSNIQPMDTNIDLFYLSQKGPLKRVSCRSPKRIIQQTAFNDEIRNFQTVIKRKVYIVQQIIIYQWIDLIESYHICAAHKVTKDQGQNIRSFEVFICYYQFKYKNQNQNSKIGFQI